MQRTDVPARGPRLVAGARLIARKSGIEMRPGLDFAVAFGDAGKTAVDQVDRLDRAAPQVGGRVGRAEIG